MNAISPIFADSRTVILVESAILRRALDVAKMICPTGTRHVHPILQSVQFVAEGGALSLVATDLEFATTTAIPTIEPVQPARFVVDHKTIHALIKGAGKGDIVRLEATEHQVAVSFGAVRQSLPTIPAADFPSVATGAMPWAFEIQADTLRNLFSTVAYAMSCEETRYYLCGALLQERNGELLAVATDGHRLAKMSVPTPSGAACIPDFIIPAPAVRDVLKLIAKERGAVSVEMSATRIAFQIGATRYTSKAIDGSFPQYDRVIPARKDLIQAITFAAASLAGSIKRVAAVSSDKCKPVKFHFSTGESWISASNADGAAAREDVTHQPRACYAGPIDTGFQARYLGDVLGTMGGGAEFRFAAKEMRDPILILDCDKPAAVHVLMPMRL